MEDPSLLIKTLNGKRHWRFCLKARVEKITLLRVNTGIHPSIIVALVISASRILEAPDIWSPQQTNKKSIPSVCFCPTTDPIWFAHCHLLIGHNKSGPIPEHVNWGRPAAWSLRLGSEMPGLWPSLLSLQLMLSLSRRCLPSHRCRRSSPSWVWWYTQFGAALSYPRPPLSS